MTNILTFKKFKFNYRISLLYFLIGLMWIFLSDNFFNSIIEDKQLLTELQTVKGFGYVLLTSILLFYLVTKHMNVLYIAKEKAEESDRLKSAFLANMSHEIRTPMNGILGFAGLLKESKLTGEEQQEYIAIIEKSGRRMLNIIDDIISISKVESGQMEVSVSEININELFEYIYVFFKTEAMHKGIVLNVVNELASNESVISTDSEKIYAILTNLVKNAIKYTNKGTIEIGCRMRRDMDTPDMEFHVRDTGIGIPKERQMAIFERFIQADISDKMALQGAGLGLSISKAYVEMLGGNIRIESEPGKGSTFYFTIPVKSFDLQTVSDKSDVSL